MTMKDLFRRATYAVKYGTIGAISGTLVATITIPTLGLVAHGAQYLGEAYIHGDYSLKNRFETAYSFKTPDAHKYYHYTPYMNGYSQDSERTRYLASPYATYGTTAAAGIAGAILLGGAGIALAKRKENER